MASWRKIVRLGKAMVRCPVLVEAVWLLRVVRMVLLERACRLSKAVARAARRLEEAIPMGDSGSAQASGRQLWFFYGSGHEDRWAQPVSKVAG